MAQKSQLPVRRPLEGGAAPPAPPPLPVHTIQDIPNLPLHLWLPDRFERARSVPLIQSRYIHELGFSHENKPVAFPSTDLLGRYTFPGSHTVTSTAQQVPGPLIQLSERLGGTNPRTAAHEAGHAIWYQESPVLDAPPQNPVFPVSQISRWKELHLKNYPNGAAAVRRYPNSWAHSFAEAVGDYVAEPERLQKESPDIYEFMRDLFGFEYSRRRQALIPAYVPQLLQLEPKPPPKREQPKTWRYVHGKGLVPK